MRLKIASLCTLAGLLLSQPLFAMGTVQIVNYYEIILHQFGLDEHAVHEWMPVLGAILTLLLTTLLGLKYSKAVRNAGENLVPESRFGVRSFVEMLFDFVSNVSRDVIGEHEYRKFLPLLISLFTFILISNLTGLVPGFPPATESLSTNLALGLTVFFAYNWAGIREHGGSYIKQFLGPVGFMMPLMIVIELVAHLARPLSLSLRLYGNIFGDHLVLSVFTGMTYLVVPAFLLFFGLLVACIQSFVFTLLSSIYISMAISHDH